MKFNSIHVKAFGHFSEFPIEFDGNQSFHVMYGENEAGKSTLLRSISQLLYGIPHQSKDAFYHPTNKLRLEAVLENELGTQLEIARRKGKSKTLLDVTGNPLEEADLNDFLYGVPEDLFRNLFALDHESLREGGEALLDSNGSLGESLFAAASGINSLRKVLDSLNEESRSLYKSSASRPVINQLVKQERELSKKVKELQLAARNWNEIERDYVDSEEELKGIRKTMAALTNELNKWTRINKTAPQIAMLDSLKTQRNEIGQVPELSTDFREIRIGVIKNQESAIEVKQRAEAEIDSLQKQLKMTELDQSLLKMKSLIDYVYSELTLYEQSKREHDNLRREATRISEKLHQASISINRTDVREWGISSSAKQRISELAKQKPIMIERKNNLMKECKKVEQAIQQRKDMLVSLGEPVEINHLKRVIKLVKSEGNLEEIRKHKVIEVEELRGEVENGLTCLPLWNGNIDHFTAFTVAILDESIATYNREINQLEDELKEVRRRIIEEQQHEHDWLEKIRTLESNTIIPTQEDLHKLRQSRNEGWSLIKGKVAGIDDPLEIEYTKGLPLVVAVEQVIQEADRVADQMLTESEKVGMKNKLLADIEYSKEKQQLFKKDVGRLEQWKETKWNEWELLWKPYQIDPLSPAEMREWLRQYDALKQKIDHYHKAQASLKKLVETEQNLSRKIVNELTRLHVEATIEPDQTLNEIVLVAEDFVEHETVRMNETVQLVTEISNKEIDLANISMRMEEEDNRLTEWEREWAEAAEAVSVPNDTPEKVLLQLDTIESLVRMSEESQKINSQILQKESYLTDIDEKIAQLAIALNRTSPLNKAQFVYDVHDSLQKQLTLKQLFDDWTTQLLKRKEELRVATVTWDKANQAWLSLLKTANAEDLPELEKVEASFFKKMEIDEQIQRIEQLLLSIGGGLTLEQLFVEKEQAELDSLDGKIREIEQQLADLEATRSVLEQQHGILKKDYQEKLQGQSVQALEAAEERESILTELADATEAYIQLKLAVLVMQKGIEQFRKQNQNPILERASRIFAQFTQGSFHGLSVDYNEKDEAVLVGLRDNEGIAIDGMSDGTKDQLYLALRIASIEKHCQENEPIPFIVDDILVHFDDERSRVTLQVLRELSLHTQIIFFTHHRHLVQLMDETVGSEHYQLVDINRQRVLS